ncbi:TadE/TadG family type IV pilus assembly protein [Streptomyces boninensis]|uniref:TadE/TadG family type IV pilus assembly protein n=1 Tax=Streptomyces boninensis TaxID=2039455 RepID=UPI003B20DF40
MRRVFGKGMSGQAGGEKRDRGSVSIEFIGFLPILLFLALAAVQLGIAAYAASQAGTAARAAARSQSVDEPVTGAAAAGSASMSGWLADGADFGVADGDEEVKVTATVKIPSLLPGIGDFGSVSRTSTMPKGEDTE